MFASRSIAIREFAGIALPGEPCIELGGGMDCSFSLERCPCILKTFFGFRVLTWRLTGLSRAPVEEVAKAAPGKPV